MKKAFTLIELLAVIIILAIIALIATPLILNVIDDAKESANLSQAYLLLDGAEQLYATSFLDENLDIISDDTETDVYDLVATSGKKPDTGTIYIKSDGKIYFRVIIDDVCYGKNYNETVITKCSDMENPEEGTDGSGNDITSTVPSINLFEESQAWNSTGGKVDVDNKGYDWKYCIDSVRCEPNLVGTGNEIELSGNNIVYVCVNLYEEEIVVSKGCDIYFLDNVVPTITAKNPSLTITKGTTLFPDDLFDIAFGKSEGIVSCDLEYTQKLEVGNYNYSCTASGNNNKSATASVQLEVTEAVEQNFSCFTYSDLGTTIRITGYQTSCGLDVVIPQKINNKPVTEIGGFSSKKINSVVFPEGVVTISNGAFQNNNLVYVNLPSSLITIGSNAFSSNMIENVVIPNNVISVGAGAFYSNEIKTLKLSDNLESIGQQAFNSNKLTEVTIPNKITTITFSSFSNNYIEVLNLGDSVVTIEAQAFSENKIKNLIIPERVTSLGVASFSANDFESFSIKGNPTITDSTFQNSTFGTLFIENADKVALNYFNTNSIKKLVIGESTTKILDSAFDNCDIEILEMGNNVTSIGSSAFSNNLINDFKLSQSLVSIGASAFSFNEIKTLALPNTVTTLGAFSFQSNVITSISLSENITQINSQTFKDNQIATLIIPDKITTIGNNAFENNPVRNLTLGANLSTIGTSAFNRASLDILVVPKTVSESAVSHFVGKSIDIIYFEGRSSKINYSWPAATKLYCDGYVEC